ncbi:MAG TPA: DUF6541 family protein [Dermatophilaceae bacterium]|nr:DUF6541 family protein [Dermatophilaceae bacterium]
MILVVAALILGPGLLALRAAGTDWLLALGAGPAVSVSAVSVMAVLAPTLGWRWGWPAALAGCAAAVAVTAALRLVPAPERHRATVLRRQRATLLGAAGGVLAGGAVVLGSIATGLGRPGALSQTYDAVFHLNAIRFILQYGDGSSLHIGAIVTGDGRPAFYPAAFHDLAALAATWWPNDLPVAANAVAVAAAVIAWPLGCAALAQVVLGDRYPWMPAVAGLFSAAFTASPYLLLSFGVLWPNALAGCLLPGALALVVHALRTRSLRSAALVGCCLPGLTLAHPNALFALVVLAAPAILLSFSPRLAWQRAARSPGRSAALLAVGLVGTAGVVLVLSRSSLLAAVRGADWPARETVAQAVGEVILSAPNRGPAVWVISGCVIVGAVVAWRVAAARWLVVAHLAVGVLYVLAAGSDSRLAQLLTGIWYNDSFRLAALLPVTAVPLAALGVSALATRLRAGRLAFLPTGVPVAVLVVLVLIGSGMLSWRDHVQRLRPPYTSTAYLGPAERQLLQRLPGEVPADGVIAGNPWNGSALAYALGSRRTLFAHLSSGWTPDRHLVASSLDRVAVDPAVCPALARLGVGWAITGRSTFWAGDRRQAAYAGLTDLAGRPGFDLIDHGGRLSLYRVTACADRAKAVTG